MNRKGVFGLTSVQQFFAIILGVALLAYVIVVIMGTLSDSTILPASSISTTEVNETGFINNTGYALAKRTTLGFASPTIITIINSTSNLEINSANWTFDTATYTFTNKTAIHWNSVKITYTYLYNTNVKNNADSILLNTSAGVSGFFSSINPVYAILAILVIILVLVVLIRVVTGSTEGTRREYSSQL